MKNILRNITRWITFVLTLLLSQTVQAQNPVGAIEGLIDVSSTGTATYTIPIEVVPGTQGMQPNLAVYYNSNAGMGLLGMKWDLKGLSTISRIPQTKYFDKNTTSVKMDNTDRFALDGQRLIMTNGTIYGGNNTQYAPEREDFSVITSYGSIGTGPEYFIVVTDEGCIMEYGRTSEARLSLVDPITIGTNVYCWMLNKITDPYNNILTFNYEHSQNYPYIKTITYYASGLQQGYARIQFSYYGNTNAHFGSFFVGGCEIKQSQVLNTITAPIR